MPGPKKKEKVVVVAVAEEDISVITEKKSDGDNGEEVVHAEVPKAAVLPQRKLINDDDDDSTVTEATSHLEKTPLHKKKRNQKPAAHIKLVAPLRKSIRNIQKQADNKKNESETPKKRQPTHQLRKNPPPQIKENMKLMCASNKTKTEKPEDESKYI